MPKSSILKKSNQYFDHVNLWNNWANILSSDQILPVIKALKINLENQDIYKESYKLYSDLDENQYMNLLLKNFFYSYKQGEINLALTNRINFEELYHLKEKKRSNKTLNFIPKISICLMKENDTNSYNPISTLSKEFKLFITCCSENESEFFWDKQLLSNKNL